MTAELCTKIIIFDRRLSQSINILLIIMKKQNLVGLLCSLLVILAVTSCSVKKNSEKLSIEFEKYILPNGLQIILHVDHSDPVIAYAVMYHVGSSREEKQKTGFAHLYEHLLFQGSENVPPGMFDKIIESAGGNNNGFTNHDVTTYYEVFPRNALEKILWLESDRMGFFINSVTPRALAVQQNVVQNEKRQYEDNSPYGFTDYVISKNLYPDNHPYNWEVIGEMEDLKNASLEDVKSFYEQYYGPNNATVVLAGDFEPDSVKPLIEKYFGEIKSHGTVVARQPMISKLEKTKKLYHEDNFANVPELNMVWPAPEAYSKDAYALDFLGKLLADGKKTPMYKVLVKEKQLTSHVNAYNSSNELAGEFTLNIRANEGKNLKEIESSVFEAFQRFEKEGITEHDVERVRAGTEKEFYSMLNSVFYKSVQLAFYNTFKNDPGYILKDIDNIKSITVADVKRVYAQYIKGKPYVATSFVPKGKMDMMADSSIMAEVHEETIENATQVGIDEADNDAVAKTASAIKRDVQPELGPDPSVNVPGIWRAKLANGVEVFGIEQNELPLVNVDVVFDGGISLDDTALMGVANLISDVMPQGTKNKTPEDLEDEIRMLGSDIQMYSGMEEIELTAGMLSRNFEKTLSLIQEIILEPRWDAEEFDLAKTRTMNQILQNEVQPRAVAGINFYRLLYGKNNIFGYYGMGSKESVAKIQVQDMQHYYRSNFIPSNTRIHIAGNITKERALEALKSLATSWPAQTAPKRTVYPIQKEIEHSQVYFIDIPGSKQSVIFAGYLALSRNDPDFVKAGFLNYRIGGAFTSILNQILREQKGFTYGAYSNFKEYKTIAPYYLSTMVRSDATLESLKIIKESLEKYRSGINSEDLQFTKDCLLKANALRFETLGSLTEMLTTLSKFGFADDYIQKETATIRNLTLEDYKAVAQKYIRPEKMIYLIVGDAATQMKTLENLGYGKPIKLNQ
jgi:zinc protease